MNVKTRDLKFHLFIHVQCEIARRQCIQSNLIQPIQFAWNWGGDLDKQHFLEYVCYVSLFEMGIELGKIQYTDVKQEMRLQKISLSDSIWLYKKKIETSKMLFTDLKPKFFSH